MSIGYCKKCKLVYHEPGVCTCGRKLNTDNDQYLDAYIEHGFVLSVPKTTASDEKSEATTPISPRETDSLQEKRLSRREEKRKQREQILKDSAEENFHETESEFDTVSFLNSLGLKVKDSES